MPLETLSPPTEETELNEPVVKPENKSVEINAPEWARQLEAYIEDLLCQLKEKIESGEYQLIIGEDASGRLPALVFNRVLKEVYKKLGYPEPKLLFVAGSSIYADDQNKDKITKLAELFQAQSGVLKRTRGKENEEITDGNIIGSKELKALIVTDTIASGGSMEPTTKALRAANIGYNIATLNMFYRDDDGFKADRENRLGATIYNAVIGGTPGIYQRHDLSGVIKSPDDLHAKRRPNRYNTPGVSIARETKMARKQVDRITERLLEKFNNGTLERFTGKTD